MKTNHHNDHPRHRTYSGSLSSNNDRKDPETMSCLNFNTEPNSNLYYLPPTATNTTSHRRTSTKRPVNTVHHVSSPRSNEIIVNGSAFDGQLFQAVPSSYVLDYNDSPRDLTRSLENHNPSAAQLDSHLYKLSFIITLSEWHVDKELVVDYCPRDVYQKHIMDEMCFYKKFCFPELNPKQKNGGNLVPEFSTYVFTRTSSNGQVEYGYCRRIILENNQIIKLPVVICIVSTHSYFKLYDAILNELARAYVSSEFECHRLMDLFYSKAIPASNHPSAGIVCKLNDRRLFFYPCSSDDRLHHDYFSTLLSSLSPNYIVHLFESMLRSKRILCFSQSLSKLSKCCLALSSLIYPFMWTYPFVSILPSSWSQDLLDSPCPYIYGCLYDVKQQPAGTLDKDSLRVDLDANTIDIGLDDGFVLPLDLRQTLQASLEYLTRFRLVKSDINLINVAVSEACLRVFTELFHRLPDFFKRDPVTQKSTTNAQKLPGHSNSIKREDSGIDLQSVASNDISQDTGKIEYKQEENRLGYEFRSDEFLILQPTPGYVTFLNDFIRGMICLKFLDDYQRLDEHSQPLFPLFCQRLNERRRRTIDELAINPVIRFREEFDLLEKQVKHTSKSSNPIFSKFVKKLFE